MTNIEILAYLPMKMKDFLFFCVNGAPDGHGGWLPDQYGRKKTGVFNWLYGREVPEAHFYTSDPAEAVQVFGATVQRLEPMAVPWMDNIPGFKDLLNVDGELGSAPSFPPLNVPLATLATNADLDKQFVDGRTKIIRVFDSLRTDEPGKWSFTAPTLRAALRGDVGTDLDAFLGEIDTKLS
jgi:hypothetical protein